MIIQADALRAHGRVKCAKLLWAPSMEGSGAGRAECPSILEFIANHSGALETVALLYGPGNIIPSSWHLVILSLQLHFQIQGYSVGQR
jgi:hypothetical protein